MVYRLVFSLAALYNIAFGIWACFWPGALFAMLEMAPPNYPSLWQCLGMVVGLYGLLYAYAAVDLHRSKLIIAIGLAGKILGPIGMFIAFQSGEWPLRALTLIVFNDFVWWLPFTVFLLDGTHIGERLRASAPWICTILNAAAAVAMLFVLGGGTEAMPNIAQRATFIAEHALLWRVGWGVWMMAAISLVAFFAWWGGWISSHRLALVALVVALAGLACDLFAESLLIGWLPNRIDTVASLASVLTGGAANGLYSIAGALLTVGTHALRGALRALAWAVWASGFALTIFTIFGSVSGMVISTAALMALLCPWVAAFGWKLTREKTEPARTFPLHAYIGLAQIGEKRSERLEVVDLRHDLPQRAHSSRNVLQKILMPSDQAQKAISTQRLHQSLGRT